MELHHYEGLPCLRCYFICTGSMVKEKSYKNLYHADFMEICSIRLCRNRTHTWRQQPYGESNKYSYCCKHKRIAIVPLLFSTLTSQSGYFSWTISKVLNSIMA